jgi:dienelactone hydrolase
VAAVLLVCGMTLAEDNKVFTQSIAYEVAGEEMEGFLGYPLGEANGAAVVVVPEWWGVNDYAKRRVEQLAELGYAAFAVDMYGKGKVTNDAKQAAVWAGEIRGKPELLRQRFDAGVQMLAALKTVDSRRIAAIGYCFGGAVCLDMARAGSDLTGVVSFHGSLKTKTPAEKGKVKARVLVLHGADDPLVPADEVAAFEQEMKNAGVDYRLVAYPGAVHSFTNPDADKTGIPGVAYQREADEKSWEEMKRFLAEVTKR